MSIRLSRQTLSSVAEVLGALSADSCALLVYKHLGLEPDSVGYGAIGRLRTLELADQNAVWSLVCELARETEAIRVGASPKYAFDGRWREVKRWLLHDGWMIENGELVRIAPAAEEATGVRDALLETLGTSRLDADGDIRKTISNAAAAFVREPPDYNASVTNVRIALETTTRRAAADHAKNRGASTPQDSWGSALAYLKSAGVLVDKEEDVLARIYTFISPGAHIPTGITEEEWARLARTFGLGACYFVLKKYPTPM